MRSNDIVIGFNGKLELNEIKQKFAKIVGDTPIIFVNFHNPDNGFGGITTVYKSIKKNKMNLSVVYRTDSPNSSGSKKRQCVYINDKLNFFYQKIYGKSYLWPLLHGMRTNLSKNDVLRGRRATVNASIIFADKIIYTGNMLKNTVEDKPIYWINDYLLIHVASILREKEPLSQIILSIRSAFDFNKKKRMFREDIIMLLQGMCASNFISFHRQRDVECFLKLLNEYQHLLDSDIKINWNRNIVTVGDRIVTPRAIPMGNDPYYRRQLSYDSKTKEFMKYLKSLVSNRNIISSISSFEVNKGIKEELDIIEKLFHRNSSLIENYVFVRVMPVRKNYDDLPIYKKLRGDVLSRIEQINIKYGKNGLVPIITFLDPNGFEDYQVAALQKISKIYLVLSLADGFNHSGIEFLLTKSKEDDPGLLIASDVGASDYLGSNLKRISPKRTTESAIFIEKLLSMSSDRISENQESLIKAANNLSSFHWTLSILSSIIRPTLVPKWRFDE